MSGNGRKLKLDDYGRKLMADVGIALLNARDSLRADGVGSQEIANRLGVGISSVARMFSGNENMTLGTIARLCRAMGMVPHFEVIAGRNLQVRRRIDFAAKPMGNPDATMKVLGRTRFPKIVASGSSFGSTTIRQILMTVASLDFEWVSLKALARMAGVSPNAVFYVLREMERLQVVECESRSRKGLRLGSAGKRYRLRVEMVKRRFWASNTEPVREEEKGEADRQTANNPSGANGADRRDPRGPAAEDAA